MRLWIVLFAVIPVIGFGQQDKEAKKKYRAFQHQLDRQHCGMGIELSSPVLGSSFTTGERWFGFNILADIAEIRFGFGRTQFSEPEFGAFGGPIITTDMHTKYMSFGVNLPLKFATLGAQGSFIKQFRGHPFIAFSGGAMRFKPELGNSYSGRQIIFMGAAPGYRLRIPLGSIDVGFNVNLGIRDGLGDGFFSLTTGTFVAIRLDALKSKLDPEMVQLSFAHAHMSNVDIESKTYLKDFSPSGYSTYTTETTTKYDIVASSGRMGFQNIGSFFGVGPRIGINNLASEVYQPRGLVYGLSAHSRASIMYLGLNFETGTMGHATLMKQDGDGYEKRIEKIHSWGKGTFNTTRVFGDVGIDITPLLFVLSGTAVSGYSDITSFSSLMFGLSFGQAFTGGQKFDDPGASARYDQYHLNFPIEQSYHNDPRLSESGFVGGWFIAIELGALEYRLQHFRFKKSPLANNKVMSVCYRIPISAGD